MSSVCLIRCKSYDPDEIESALRKSLDLLGGMSRFVKSGDRVLLKPNLLSSHPPERRVTTDPEVVHAVARLVLEAGGDPFIGDSPGLHLFKRVSAKTGMDEISKKLGIDIEELSQSTHVNLPDSANFKNLEIAAQALKADVVINLHKLKTHCQMLLTLGVKNLFGTIVAQRKSEWHHMVGLDRDTFASLLLDIYMAVGPALTILDGVWGMEGRGPANGTPRRLNLIAASEDAVALDVSICRLLGVPLSSFPLYREARKRGFGETDAERISLLGEPLQSFEIHDFQIPELDSLHILPGMFDWFTRRYLVSKPVPEKSVCIGCAQCAEICPEEAIELNDRRLTFDYDKCIRCYCCQEICPEDSIRFRKGMLVRLLNRIKR